MAGLPHSKEEMDAWLKDLGVQIRKNQGLPEVDENARTDESTFLGDYMKKLEEIEATPVEELQSLKNSVKAIVDDEELKKMSPNYHKTFESETKKILAESEGVPNKFVHKELAGMVTWLRKHIEDQLFTLQGGRRRRRKTRRSRKTRKTLRKK